MQTQIHLKTLQLFKPTDPAVISCSRQQKRTWLHVTLQRKGRLLPCFLSTRYVCSFMNPRREGPKQGVPSNSSRRGGDLRAGVRSHSIVPFSPVSSITITVYEGDYRWFIFTYISHTSDNHLNKKSFSTTFRCLRLFLLSVVHSVDWRKSWSCPSRPKDGALTKIVTSKIKTQPFQPCGGPSTIISCDLQITHFPNGVWGLITTFCKRRQKSCSTEHISKVIFDHYPPSKCVPVL